MDDAGRSEALRSHEEVVGGCTACALAGTRVRVVVGGGSPRARVLVVGESPGFQEERDGVAIAGEAGALLERLLAGVGVEQDQVYRTTLLKCRPPASRDPLAEEIAACEPHLFRQIELVRPTVVVTLGTVATRVLSGRPHPITSVHGTPQELTIGAWTTTLLPLYHPAAAVYTPATLRTLEDDVAVLGRLLGSGSDGAEVDPPAPVEVADVVRPVAAAQPAQLGLF